MRYLIVLLLAGCAMTAEEHAAFNQRADDAFDICARTLTPGSEEHYRCVERLLGIQKPPIRTDCRRDVYGDVQCVTR